MGHLAVLAPFPAQHTARRALGRGFNRCLVCLALLNAIRERFTGLLYSSAGPWGRADLHQDLPWLRGGVEANGGWLAQQLDF